MSEPDSAPPNGGQEEPIARALAARERRVDGLIAALWGGPGRPTDIALALTFVGAIGARWTLSNCRSEEWIPWMTILSVGGLTVLWKRNRLGWLLCAIGIGVPFLTLRDWLTQSFVMLLIALVGLVTVDGRKPDSGRSVRDAAWLITAGTYLVAAFHKLNEGFFSVQRGCANEGWRRVDAMFEWAPLAVPGALEPALPYAVVVAEVLIFALLLRAPRVAILVGVLFHVPLTWAFAPAFVFVMFIGYAAALSDEACTRLFRAFLRRFWLCLVVYGLVFGAYAWASGFDSGRSDLWVKTPILALVFGLVAEDLWRHPSADTERDVGASAWRKPRWLAVAAFSVFSFNGLTPYIGTQMQHTGAMLSNLRIDPECWNHFVIPPSALQVDPFLRIEEASLGDSDEDWLDIERILRERLWNATQVLQMRRNWCGGDREPIALSGTFRGEPWAVDNLCEEGTALPSGPGVLGGVGWFPDFLRHQKNLPRVCDMPCIH